MMDVHWALLNWKCTFRSSEICSWIISLAISSLPVSVFFFWNILNGPSDHSSNFYIFFPIFPHLWFAVAFLLSFLINFLNFDLLIHHFMNVIATLLSPSKNWVYCFCSISFKKFLFFFVLISIFHTSGFPQLSCLYLGMRLKSTLEVPCAWWWLLTMSFMERWCN